VKPRRFITTTIIALAATSTASASPYRYNLTTTSCVHAAVPTNAGGQPDPAWLPFAPYIESCPVLGPARRIALQILTIRRDLIDKSAADNVPDDVNAKILSPENHDLGALIQTFPTAYPETITLSFQNWRQNLPHKIVETSSDNLGLSAPGGDLTIFLWDPRHAQYVRQSPLPAWIRPNHS